MTSASFCTSYSTRLQGRSKYYAMLKKSRQGELVQVRRGVYATANQLADVMIDINAIAPGGVICRWTAWSIYSLTTTVPQAFHIAVKRGRKIVAPLFPSVEFHSVSDHIFDLGITTMKVSGYTIRIYDMERCVCDAIKYRHKIGTDICAEVLSNYLSLPTRNIDKLMTYARQLRVANLLQNYLDVKL